MIFSELNQADVTVIAMTAAAVRTGVMISSPDCKPSTTKSNPHIDTGDVMATLALSKDQARKQSMRACD